MQAELTPAVAERAFGAMGCEAQVIVVGGRSADPLPLLDRGVSRVRGLESRWSRFLPASEVSRLNALPSLPVVVAPETYALVELAVAGWRLTGGRFDPTVLPATIAAGYDRTFEELRAGPAPAALEPVPGAGCDSIELDPALGSVRLGAGTAFDPGGVAKGFAAELVVGELLGAGARGACVNIGGDLFVDGDAPDPRGWLVGVAAPTSRQPGARSLRIRRGGVASTSRALRAWTDSRGEKRHHLIDPRTGAPARGELLGASVVAGHGWLAEVLAKGAFLAGVVEGPALLRAHGAEGILFPERGDPIETPGLAAFVA